MTTEPLEKKTQRNNVWLLVADFNIEIWAQPEVYPHFYATEVHAFIGLFDVTILCQGARETEEQ